MLGALEVLLKRMRRNCVIDVCLKQLDSSEDWLMAGDRIWDLCNFLYRSKQCRGQIVAFSTLRELDNRTWELLYDRPRVRVGWIASDLVSFQEPVRFD
jgi:hypothetical protein